MSALLAIAPADVSAEKALPYLVQVSLSARGKSPCTGVRLRRGGILTARHCVNDGESYTRGADEAAFSPAVLGWMSRTLDLAILTSAPSASGLEVAGLQRLANLRHAPLWVATRGAGLTRALLASADERFIRVVARGAALCFGDSGSPLLTESQGRPRVIGVLDVGAADCQADGVNRFVRVDGLDAHGSRAHIRKEMLK